MKQALGLVEIEGLTTAVVVADTMAKAANIEILAIENTKGLGYMTIKIAGDVGAVSAAVTAGKQIGMINKKLISWKVIARPSDYVERMFCDPKVPEMTSPQNSKQQEAAKSQIEAKTKAKPEPVQKPAVSAEPEVLPELEAPPEPVVNPEPEAEKREAVTKKSTGTRGKK